MTKRPEQAGLRGLRMSLWSRESGRLLAGLVALLLWMFSSAAHAAEVVIFKSNDIAAYNQAIGSFKAALPPATTVTEYNLQGDLEQGRKFAKRVRASDALLVLAVGLKAALAAKLEIVDIPVVYCMVLDPDRYDLKAPNMLGVLLEVPLDRQLAVIHDFLPDARRFGVLYDPAKSGPAIAEARRQAKVRGFELNARPVSSEKDVPAATRALLPKVDALWLIPDSTVLNEDSLRFLLGAGLDLNVPIVGFSAEFVRSGALLGLSVSYPDTGRQAGQLAKRLLEGRLLPRGDTVAPDQIRLSLNQKTAKFLRLTIPEDILRQVEDLH